MRGGGGPGAAGLLATGALGGATDAAGGGAACAMISSGALGGAAGGSATGRGGAGVDGVDAAGAGGLTTGGATGTLATGRATVCGVMKRGAGGGGGAAGFAAAGGVAGGAGGAATLVSMAGAGGRTGGAGGGAGVVAACCCLVMSLSTSPGLEMCDRSILVLISSASRPARALEGADWASAAARKCARTFSASCSSTELECVFFSVTPTATRTSRIALLLTSSSLARSLIRILLIRPFLAPPPLPKSS
jgi:hypothetical protein